MVFRMKVEESPKTVAEQYETIIGLEVHIELSTRTKIFCGCSTEFGGKPNTQICPVCTGMPGSLPVLNKKVVEYGIAAGLAMNCQISRKTQFDRKNYFYPDNPQNYQISQLYFPLCRDGKVQITLPDGAVRKIRIHEIHMEEDAGKLIHEEGTGNTLVDYNRSGVPLLEIVSEPDMRSSEEVIAYLEHIRMLMQYLNISDCKLQEGSMRADVNLSVRKKGEDSLGTRTEMKNLNSFRAITRAIEAERARQIDILENGGGVIQETRRWDDERNQSFSMRSKEDAKDYRYFPEPDLVPIEISEEWIQRIEEKQPEFRPQKQKRFQEEYGLPEYDSEVLTMHRAYAELFERTTAICGLPKKVSNWIMGETMRIQNERMLDPSEIMMSPEHFAEFILLVEKREINQTVAKQVFEVLLEKDIAPAAYVAEKGLSMVQDEALVRQMVDKVLIENPQSVTDYRNGKERALGFLVGQTMKAAKGKTDPEVVNRILRELLGCQE